ncbi:MAG: adenylate/guanylate cyclase domain-containing protein [Spirochaetales bacterium]|nr:adenylate/guanylate cyclase domain-containing protein [Spirochaetales bacterium]
MNSEIKVLQTKQRLSEEFDTVIEQCLQDKLPIRKALARVIPVICRIIGAHEMMIRTMDENLKLISMKSKGFHEEWASLVPRELPELEFEPRSFPLENEVLVVASLDVVDRVIGICAFAFRGELSQESIALKADLVDTAAELLDNYLEGIASNARKQSITMYSTEALRDRIFEKGADKAVGHLCDELKLHEFILVYGDSDTATGEDLRYRYYCEGKMIHNSIDNPAADYQEILSDRTRALDPKDRSFSGLLVGEGIQEKALQNGLNQSLIGKLIVNPRDGGLNPESRDIIRIFAECLCQRLFDYNRERRYLAKCFCARDVQRLLSEPDFYNRYLSPREEDIVILYSDITSFTAICEKVLTSASEIGDLINRWSEMVLKILYRHEGVFDKMVGDCVIGLFGPPFFESSMEARTENAIAAAAAIVRETIALGKEMGLEERITEAGVLDSLNTSNGIHCGPTSVGFFGPNEDYTGFSSAMNHSARLQGHASAGEVLVSSALLENLPGGPLGIAPGENLTVDFEGPWEIAVKNVSHPLEYYRCYFNRALK